MNAPTLPANVSIGNVLIHQQDGLFSLNDLHKASGSDQKHKPALFLRHDQTQALITKMSKGTKVLQSLFSVLIPTIIFYNY